MKQIYKSISFPKALNRQRETKVLKLAISEKDNEIAKLIKDLNSSQIRTLLNNKNIEDLQEKSYIENRSLNNTCILLIKENLAKYNIGNQKQLDIFWANPSRSVNLDSPSVTFRNNKEKGVFNWYPYIEGFSYDFVEHILEYVISKPRFIFDPFAGTGTTVLVASQQSIKSGFSEINPLMRFIIETKISAIANREIIKSNLKKVFIFLEKLYYEKEIALNEHYWKLVKKGFFREDILKQLVILKHKILQSPFKSLIKNVLLIGLSSIIVKESNMIRRADLRYKRDKEFNEIEEDVISLFANKCKSIFLDLDEYKNIEVANTKFISANAKEINHVYDNSFDLVVTSPPYVNGTNYFRNTKLELLFLDFIKDEDDLKKFRTAAITSGINNVSNRKKAIEPISYVEPLVQKLKENSYDPRIPKLVKYYFCDMKMVFANLFRIMTDSGDFFIDIGDSKFKDVHIPTDLIFDKIGKQIGLELIEKRKVRNRFSKDGTPLGQWLMHFKKDVGYSRKNGKFQITKSNIKYFETQKGNARELMMKNWKLFRDQLPYLNHPYRKRNWGNKMHSLCSYQGKLKPAIAYFLIRYFTSEDMRILDPLCGVGTIPFEASLQGRIAYGSDLSLLAYSNTLAKLGTKKKNKCTVLINSLKSYITKNLPSDKQLEFVNIDFNRNIREYYHTETFKEIFAAREFFKQFLIKTPSDAVVFASLLHILHGNRPYALSRISHPITPFAPKGEFIYKSLIDKLEGKVNRVLNIEMSDSFKQGKAIWDDFSNLNKHIEYNSIDAIITSPPFYNSTRFYLANWIRMWFAGWDKEDFNVKKEHFLETSQVKDINIYESFFYLCHGLLKKNGSMILHLGFSKKANMAEMLIPIAQKNFDIVGYFNENVNNNETFGITDVGSVKMHQFLFLIKK